MESPYTLDIDLETILTPIEGDNPAGEDLREDSSPTSVYYQIKDARTGARAAERQIVGDEDEGGLLPEWLTILDIAPGVLAERAKDLEVAAWLTEAMLRARGFAGLRDGFKIIKGLVDSFWDNLYPLEDEDGLETKVAPLTGLNGEGGDGTLIQPIRKVPLTSADVSYAAYHYDQANDLVNLDDEKRERRIADGSPTLDQLGSAARQSPKDFLLATRDDLEAAVAAFGDLTAAVDGLCGADGPPSSNIRNALSAVREAFEFLTRDISLEEPGGEAAAEDAAADGASAAGEVAAAGNVVAMVPGATVAAGAIATREDAFKQLLKIAEFFKKTEPHSPMSYTLEELVRRGRMPLADLLAELIPDQEARSSFLLRAGIVPPEEPPVEEGY